MADRGGVAGLFILLLQTIVFRTADCGLICLADKAVPHPSLVTSIARCGPHEVCGMEQYITHDGSVRHNLLCKDKTQCNSAVTASSGIHICSACCDTDLCSANLCKNKGLASGTFCLHCDYPVKTPLNCEKIKRCSADESCGVNQMYPSNEFEVKCRSKSSCSTLLSTTVCSGCCNTNVCNNRCSNTTTACSDDAVCAGIKQNFQSSGRDICTDPTFKNFCNSTCGFCPTTSTLPVTSPTTVTTTTTTLMTSTSKPVTPCQPNPCVHGTCSSTSGSASYSCTCNSGYGGTNCDTVTPCQPNPCVHGTCSSTGGSAYSCTCNSGYGGQNCDTATPCQPNPCVHGTCSSTVGSAYSCTCNSGYGGTNCDTATPCQPNPCVHGTCSSTGGPAYSCTCNSGYGGTNCDRLMPCQPNPCVHGTCSSPTGSSTYFCKCNTGYTGPKCNMQADPCANIPCRYGNCSAMSGVPVCLCHPGYNGTSCDTDIDECLSSPCVHGSCRDKVNGYTCMCNSGYTGKNCDQDIDECLSSPCMHGTCRDNVNGYTCTCSSGYSGKNCDQVTTTPCTPSPCTHGTCSVTSTSGYSCACNTGFSGVNCSTVVLPCSTNPCLNGKCVDQGTSYSCQCNVGYFGQNCDKKVRDCKDILDNHIASPTNDAIFTIMIGQNNENVRCDQITDGGGWTVIMNRETSTSNFLQKSTEYAVGFGSVREDFWIGLEDMHSLTSDGRRYQLRVEMTRGDGRKYYEVYDDFSIGPRNTFVLHIGQERGNAGDALRKHDGYAFTTIDVDHDSNKGTNCAQYLQGAWWFNDCYDSCLTCPYVTPGTIQCRSMSWNTVNYCEALKTARMLVRPM